LAGIGLFDAIPAGLMVATWRESVFLMPIPPGCSTCIEKLGKQFIILHAGYQRVQRLRGAEFANDGGFVCGVRVCLLA
jgi:hypothetical protein